MKIKKIVLGCEPAQRCSLKAVAAMRDQRPKAGAAACRGCPWPRDSGPSGRASRRARHTHACGYHDHGWHGGMGARLVDRWPRVAAIVPEAPRELGESDDQRFEDGDSPGRCGDGGAVEAG
jgi:hypothetical protein